jgi:polar amino acid transport system permease protein
VTGARRRLIVWLALGAAVVAALYVVVAYVVDWPFWAEPIARFILTEGLPNTLLVSAIAVAGSVAIGITLGTLMTIGFAPSRLAIRGYIEVFRGLPILVTVLIVFLGLPALTQTLKFSALMGAAIALVLWGSAQVAEATRGAVQSIPREQHEAASALGFGWIGAHGFVILPQALRRLLPPLVGLLVNIIQNSTLAAAIGGTADELELLAASKSQVERLTFFPPAGLGEIHAVEIFGGVMILFFLISFPLTRLAAWLERRLV